MNFQTISVEDAKLKFFNDDGLPMGMQIIAKKFNDLQLLAFAKQYEECFNSSTDCSLCDF